MMMWLGARPQLICLILRFHPTHINILIAEMNEASNFFLSGCLNFNTIDSIFHFLNANIFTFYLVSLILFIFSFCAAEIVVKRSSMVGCGCAFVCADCAALN
jgi:hypothetical protein